MSEWQPIETAPKDGTSILTSDPQGAVCETRWLSPGPYVRTECFSFYKPDGFYWSGWDGAIGPVNPSLWRHMPTPSKPFGTSKMDETKNSQTIRDALNWIGCMDERCLSKMDNARDRAECALEEILEDRARLITACEKLAYPDAYSVSIGKARDEARRVLNSLYDAPHFGSIDDERKN